MDVDAGPLVRVLRQHAREQRHAEVVEHMGQPLERDGQHARVGEDDFLDAARGGIACVGGVDVGLDEFAQLRELGEKRGGELARLCRRRRDSWRSEGTSRFRRRAVRSICASS